MFRQSEFLLLILLYLSYPFSEIFISYLSGFHQLFFMMSKWMMYSLKAVYYLHFLECLTLVFIHDRYLMIFSPHKYIMSMVLNVSVEKFDFSIKLLFFLKIICFIFSWFSKNSFFRIKLSRIWLGINTFFFFFLVLILLIHFPWNILNPFCLQILVFLCFRKVFISLFFKKFVYNLKWGRIF